MFAVMAWKLLGEKDPAIGSVDGMPRVNERYVGYLSGNSKSSSLWCQSAAAMYSCQIGTGKVAPATVCPCTLVIGISPFG